MNPTCPGFSLATCELLIYWEKFHGIGHVLSKIMFHETLKSSIEQCFKAGYTIKLEITQVSWTKVSSFSLGFYTLSSSDS